LPYLIFFPSFEISSDLPPKTKLTTALSSKAMANLTLNSKVQLNSGYDIPRLGFGEQHIPYL
jgi:hypothetical protein